MWSIFQYIKYLFRSFHLHGIHSPFVYELNENIFKEKTPFYVFDEIEAIRAKLLLTTKKIKVDDLGAGSKRNNADQRRISDIAKLSLKKPKTAQLLFRLLNRTNAETILELGTSLGISTAYLAKACPNAKVVTIEGASEVAKVAEVNLRKLNVLNVRQVIADFDSALPIELEKLKRLDFVFFDGNHQLEPTLHYFNTCVAYAQENSVFVFDDIYWSKEMTMAWEKIKAHPKVTITVDCYEMGFVFFKKDQAKEHFTVYH